MGLLLRPPELVARPPLHLEKKSLLARRRVSYCCCIHLRMHAFYLLKEVLPGALSWNLLPANPVGALLPCQPVRPGRCFLGCDSCR